MTRWDLVYKWADPSTRSIVDAVTSALENCDRKLTEAEALDVRRDTAERIIQRLHAEAWRTAPEGMNINGWFDVNEASRICGEEAGHSQYAARLRDKEERP